MLKPNLASFREGPDPAPEAWEPPVAPFRYRVRRPEEFGPRLKGELRTLIETFRQAYSAFMQATAADRPGAIKSFTKAFESAVAVLEPVLPLQVTLLDEYRPTEIRRRSQIKTNVLGAVYRAIS